MADVDINTKTGSQSTKIAGADPATGNETNFAQVDALGALNVSMPSVASTINSTTAVLAANATFTGTSEDVTGYAVISVEVFTDQPSATLGLKPQYSPDGTNWDDGDTYAIIANDGKFFTFPPENKFFRLVYTNGATIQTAFRLQTVFHRTMIKASSHRIGDSMSDENDAELVKASMQARHSDGTHDNVRSTANNDLGVADMLDGGGVTGVISVPANTATPIRVGASNLANRKRLLFIPTTGVSMFWSLSASLVGASNGMTIFKNQPVSDNWGPNTTVYIYSTVTGALSITESA